jgi:DNA-binding TFAR19-related protein (PDSD5 family)
MSQHVNFKSTTYRIYCHNVKVITVPAKKPRDGAKNLSFRVKTGEQEVELSGLREDVLKTIEELPNIITHIQKAFETMKPKTVATLTVKTQTAKEERQTQKQEYPRVDATEDCSKAILRILESEWGKWRPRTIEELGETLKANGIACTGRNLTKVLIEMVQSGRVRRWNTDAGFVYILAEKEMLNPKGEIK